MFCYFVTQNFSYHTITELCLIVYFVCIYLGLFFHPMFIQVHISTRIWLESTEIGDGQLSVHILPAVSVPYNVLAAELHSLTSQRRHAIKTPITADLKTIVISRPTTTRDNHNTQPGHHHRPDSPPCHATNTTTSHLAPLHEILYTRSAHHTHSHHEILFHSPSAFHTTPSLFLLLFLPFFFSSPPPLPLFVLSTWKPQKRWSEANPFMPLPPLLSSFTSSQNTRWKEVTVTSQLSVCV